MDRPTRTRYVITGTGLPPSYAIHIPLRTQGNVVARSSRRRSRSPPDPFWDDDYERSRRRQRSQVEEVSPEQEPSSSGNASLHLLQRVDQLTELVTRMETTLAENKSSQDQKVRELEDVIKTQNDTIVQLREHSCRLEEMFLNLKTYVDGSLQQFHRATGKEFEKVNEQQKMQAARVEQMELEVVRSIQTQEQEINTMYDRVKQLETQERHLDTTLSEQDKTLSELQTKVRAQMNPANHLVQDVRDIRDKCEKTAKTVTENHRDIKKLDQDIEMIVYRLCEAFPGTFLGPDEQQASTSTNNATSNAPSKCEKEKTERKIFFHCSVEEYELPEGFVLPQ